MRKLKEIITGDKDPLEVLKHEETSKEETSNFTFKVSKEEKEKIREKQLNVTRKIYVITAIICAIIFTAILLIGISYLPRFGNEGNPTNNTIVDHYIGKGTEETGVTNYVSGMILDYRAFDTLGESFVLFTAVSAVFILLKNSEKKEYQEKFSLSDDPILKSCACILIPIIFLFGAYVILNGSISPGGGFSGGAIIGAGLILYSLAFGFEKMSKFFTIKTFKVITTFALLCYCFCKAYAFYTGANHYESIFEHLVHLQTAGNIFSGGLIFILNICVGLVVSCTMYGFYSLFKRGEI